MAPRIVEVLTFEGCPHADAAFELANRVVRETGASAEVRRVDVPDAEAAVAQRFLGSPTIRVDACDVEPGADERVDYALSCRVYRTSVGFVGKPQELWVRNALILSTWASAGLGGENLQRVRLVDAVVQPHNHVVARPERKDLEQRHRSGPLRRQHRNFDGDPVTVLDQLAKPEPTSVRVLLLEPINDRCAVRTRWRLVFGAPPRDSNPFRVRVEQLSERRDVACVQGAERLPYEFLMVGHRDPNDRQDEEQAQGSSMPDIGEGGASSKSASGAPSKRIFGLMEQPRSPKLACASLEIRQQRASFIESGS